MDGKITMRCNIKMEDEKQQDQSNKKVPVCNRIVFEGSGLVLVSQIVPGMFPDYTSLIPTKGKTLSAKKSQLQEAVKMAMSINKDAIVRFTTTSKGLRVWSVRDEQQAETIIPCRGQSKIAFSGSYFLDMIQRTGDVVELKTTGPGKAGAIKNNGTIHVLMPHFVEWEKPKPKAFNGVTTMRPVVGTPAQTDKVVAASGAPA